MFDIFFFVWVSTTCVTDFHISENSMSYWLELKSFRVLVSEQIVQLFFFGEAEQKRLFRLWTKFVKVELACKCVFKSFGFCIFLMSYKVLFGPMD